MSKLILICTATLGEMEACISGLGERFESLPELCGRPWVRSLVVGHQTYCLAVTGAGIPLTMARLLPLTAELSPSLIVNLGIAGAYPGSGLDLDLGDLVAGDSECFGDLGLESPGSESFLPLATLPWADDIYRQPLSLELGTWSWAPQGPKGRDVSPVGFHRGRGCTVNQCTGKEATGTLRRALFQADFESMEGAAVALVAKMLGTPISEMRSISNFASTRDMRPENIALALGNLGVYITAWLGRAA